jgi:hypothetical protein
VDRRSRCDAHKAAALQPDRLSAPSGAFLRALVDNLQANGLVKLLDLAEAHAAVVRRRLTQPSGNTELVQRASTAHIAARLP